MFKNKPLTIYKHHTQRIKKHQHIEIYPALTPTALTPTYLTSNPSTCCTVGGIGDDVDGVGSGVGLEATGDEDDGSVVFQQLCACRIQ